ncbi:MAG: FAD-dependent oxidoreductase [Lachnospiraceae bacterium]|nr:FAD-dependent oxidoreductase [Lachnospiraceae bacterium]
MLETDKSLYDVVIVGGGPAGLSAAIYAARAKFRVLVVEKSGIGGQITITSEIVNYPGVEYSSGKELTEKMRLQAEGFGAEFLAAEVVDMELEKEIKTIRTTRGEYQALGVVLATGANPRKLGFKGEKAFQGRGVAYCATCDGEFFTGKEVFVIGGGFAAVEEGIFLTKYAVRVTLIVREENFTCARTVWEKLEGRENIRAVFRTELIEVAGEDMVTYARFRNNETGEEWSHEAAEGFGVFVFAGYVPNSEWIGDSVKKDEQGYLLTDRDQKTSLEGVYGAGDICVKNLRQVVTAVSDGAVAATSLEKVVSGLHEKLDIPPLVRMEKHPHKGKKSEDGLGEGSEGSGGEFLNAEIRAQLEDLFARFEHSVILKVWLDDQPLSGEVMGFIRELEDLTDKVAWRRAEWKEGQKMPVLPSVEICREDGSSSGIHFHGVPGGHEFNSFVIALYNAAGPGQQVDEETEKRLRGIRGKHNLKVLVSLSCTMCPETVMSAQKAAALSENIEAEMFDLAHFPRLKEKYKVMSVPCLILNDEKVFFGKKNIKEITDILASAEGNEK